MEGKIKKVVEQVVVGNPIKMGALTVFPLSWREGQNGHFSMAVLEEGINSGKVLVEEISEGERVPEISVTNDLNQDLFILEGEEVRGAMQNRVLNISVCIGAKTKVTIPVTCVEQGRWDYRSRRFTAGKRACFRMRRDSSQAVNYSLIYERQYRSNQAEMWKNVESILREFKIESPTAAYADAFDAVETRINVELDRGVQLPPGPRALL